MYATIFALLIIIHTAIKVLREVKPMWEYDPHKSDWDNTVDLVHWMNYTPEIPFDSFIACILLHYEGACEREDSELTLKEYLETGIRDREEGMLADFDYE